MILLVGAAIADGAIWERLCLLAAGRFWTLGVVWRAEQKQGR